MTRKVVREKSDKPGWGTNWEDFLANSCQYIEDGGYGAPPNNGIEERLRRTANTIGRFLALLSEKGIITDQEALKVVDLDDYEMRGKEIVILD